MSNNKPELATVRRSLLTKKTMAEGLSALATTCTSGAQCPAVQASPVAQQALAVLTKATTTGATSLAAKVAAEVAFANARKVLRDDYQAARVALTTYESAVAALAGGSATVIGQAGLPARLPTTAATLTPVSAVRSKVGKASMEAILSWPAAPGATGYAIEVNFTPQSATPAWVALTSGTSRRRVVKAPTPGAQFLVRIASLGSGGTQADWSDPVMATAR